MINTLVVYLHGFRSSPRSSKAVMTAEAIASLNIDSNQFVWFCPQLLASPKESMDLVMERIDSTSFDRLVVIGSSLGGFYANYLAEKYDCKAVVLNPAVRAPRELAPHVGMMTSYDSDEPFDFRPEYIGQLESYQVEQITSPQRYFLIAAKGDELLDWRVMAEFYKGAKQLVLEGSDHGIADYKDHLPEVIKFISS